MILTGTVSATNGLTVTSDTGSILAAQAGTSLTGRTVNLSAGGEIGDAAQSLSTQSNTVNAAAGNGGVYLSESNGLTIGTLTAAGTDNNVVLNATQGNITVGSITATGGNVGLTAGNGSIVATGSTTNVTAKGLTASAKSGVGASNKKLATSVDTLTATTTAAQAGVYATNDKALSALSVTTPNGETNVAFTGGALLYSRTLSTLGLTNTQAMDLTFSNTATGFKVNGINAGADKSVSLTAAGDITQGSGSITAKNLVIDASGSVGSADTALVTAASNLTMTSRNGIANVSNTSSDLGLTATATATNGAVTVAQTGNLVVNSVNTKTAAKLTAGGAVTGAADATGAVISAGSLNVSAASVGTATKALASKVAGAVNLTATAGDVNASNIGAITLLDVLANSGKIAFQNSGDAVVGQLKASGTINFQVSGNVTDGNGSAANFVTSGLTAAVKSFGTSSDAIEIQVDELVIDAANGGIYARQSNGNLISLKQVTSGGSGSDINISADGSIKLGNVNSGGNNVTIAAGGSIEDGRTDKTVANVVARSLDISAPNGIGQQGELGLDVSFLSAAGGSGGVTATNAGAVAVDASSLTGKGASAINIVATAITVLDNSGGTITMDGGSLVLKATSGNIVFLNQNDTIYLPGGGSITLLATSKSGSDVPGYDGVIIAGNLKTDGGDITLKAQSNITIGMLDAGTTGNVTVASAGGVILDGNGTAQNIRGNHVSLTASTPSQYNAELTRDTAIAEYSARDAEAAAKLLQLNILIQQLKDYEALVTSATVQNSLAELTQRLADVAAAAQSSKVDSMSATADALNTALNAATVVRNAAAVIAGAAQAVPFSGDAGADAAFAVVDLVMSAASLALDSYERYSLAPQQDLLVELNNTLDVANAAVYTAATNLATTTAIRDTTATSKAAADLAVFKANTARDAALQVRKQAVAAYAQNQQIDSSADKPLGITANRLDINDGGVIDSSLYLNSTGSLGLGNITVASGDKIVAEATGNVGVVGTVTSDTSISLKAGQAILGQGGVLVTPDLQMVATNGIGALQAINTQTDRVAADAGNGGVAIVNANGGALLTIGTEGAVKGITGAGDISVTTDGSLKIDQLVKDSTHTHTVNLTATNGSIIDGNTVDRNVQGGTLVAKAAGAIDLDTEVDTLNAEVTQSGNITVREGNAVTARNLKTASGNIDLKAGGAMVVGSVDAGTGTVGLQSDGAMDDDQDDTTRIVADTLNIHAAGTVGATGSTANRHLDTKVNTVNVSASGEVNLAEVDDLNVGTLETDHGNVTVTTGGSLNLGSVSTDTTGSDTVTLVAGNQITNGKTDGTSNIDTANLSLSAQNGIGNAKALGIKAGNLVARSTSGSVKVSDLDGDLTIGGVTPNLGNTVLTGVSNSNGDIDVSTTGSLTVNQTVANAGDGAARLTAGANVVQHSNVTTHNGDLAVKAGGNIDMQAGTYANSAGTGNVSYNAGGDANLRQIDANSGNIDLTAQQGQLTLNNSVQTNAGNIAAKAGANLLVNNLVRVNGTGNIGLNAGADLLQNDIVRTVTGNVTAHADHDLTMSNSTSVLGSGFIDYSAGGNADLQMLTTNSGNITLDAGGNLTQNGLVQTLGGNITAHADGDLTMLANTAIAGTGIIDYSADANASLLQLTTNGGDIKLNAGGNLTQRALVQTLAGNITAHAGGNLTTLDATRNLGAGAIDYSAGGNVNLQQLTTYSGDITLNAVGNLTQNALVQTGQGNITAHADGDLATLDQTSVSTTGNIDYSAGGNASLQQMTTTTGNINLSTVIGDLTQNALVATATGNVTAKAGRDLLMAAATHTTVTRGAIDYSAGRNASLENLATVTGDVTLSTQGNLQQNGTVETNVGNITASATGDLTMNAAALTQANAQGNIGYTAGSNASLQQITSGNGNVTLSAQTGDLTQNALVATATGNVTAKAGRDLLMATATHTNVAGNGSIDYSAGRNANLENLATVTGDVTLSTQGNLQQNGTVETAQGNVVANATGDLTMAVGALTQVANQGNIGYTAGSNASLQQITSGNGNVTLSAQTGDLTQNALVSTASGNVTAKAGRDLLMATATHTNVAGAGFIDYSAGRNASLENLATGNGDVTLSAQGNLQQNGTVETAQGNVVANATGDLTMNIGALTRVDGLGNITYGAGANLTVDQIATGNGNVTLTATTGDIQVQGTAARNVSAKQLTATAGGSIGTNDALRTSVDNLTGSASSGSIVVDEADAVTLDNIAASNGSVSVSAGDITVNQLQGSSIALDSTGQVVTATGGLVKGSSLNVSAQTGVNLHTAVDSTTVGNASGNVVLTEDDGITLTRVTTNDGDIRVTAGGDIGVGTVAANNGNVSLTSTGGAIVTQQQNLFVRLLARVAQATGITADRVDLNAANGLGNGSAGALQLHGNTVSASTTGGDVNLAQSQAVTLENVSTGNGNIALTVADGDATVGSMSATGTVGLTTENGQLVDDGNSATRIKGDALNLTASNGMSVQTQANSINAQAATGNVTLNEADGLNRLTVNSTNGDVAVSSNTGNIGVDVVNASGHNVSLNANTGAIIDANGNSVSNVNAQTANLTGANGVGQTGNALEVNVQTLAGNGGNGGVHLNSTSTSALNLSSLSAAQGDISLATAGDLNVNGAVANSGTGNIALSGANVNQNANITTRGRGNVSVTGSGDVVMAAGSTTSTDSGSVSYQGGKSIQVASVQTSNAVGGGKVTFVAPQVLDNMPGVANVRAWQVSLKAGNGNNALVKELVGDVNDSSTVDLGNRVIGGSLAESRRFMDALLQPAVVQHSGPERVFDTGVLKAGQITASHGFVEGEDGVLTYK